MVNTKIRFIIFFAAKNGKALYSQQKQDKDGKALYSKQKQDWEQTLAQIMNSLLAN